MKRLGIATVALVLLLTSCGKPDALPTGGQTASSVPVSGTTMPTVTTTTTTIETTTTTTTTTAPTRVTIDGVTYIGDAQEGLVATDFELPLRGATGFISVATPLYSDSARTVEIATLTAGEAFTVLAQTAADTWQVRLEDGTEGYVENTTCYLNIADVIPSVVLDNTNSYSSVFLSSGKEIPTVTGEQLYDSETYNPRLGRKEFLVACNWQMVKKIYAAQQAALAQGYTLIINEAFRPMDVQLNIAATLKELYDTDAAVKAGIDTTPWNISWFIANRPSTHQMGCAIDTSLAKVTEVTYRLCGGYRYREVTGFVPCAMPTPIHELSAAAVSLSKPVNSYSPTAWQTIAPAKTMTEEALKLREICTGAGMSPLASEWWHFNDLQVKEAVGDRYTTDPFYLDTCLSEIP